MFVKKNNLKSSKGSLAEELELLSSEQKDQQNLFNQIEDYKIELDKKRGEVENLNNVIDESKDVSENGKATNQRHCMNCLLYSEKAITKYLHGTYQAFLQGSLHIYIHIYIHLFHNWSNFSQNLNINVNTQLILSSV